MKKLRIRLDELSIESFDTTPEMARERGTVRGHGSVFETCLDLSCEGSCFQTNCFPDYTGDCSGTGTGTGTGTGSANPTACTQCDLSCFDPCDYTVRFC
jgi:hypothetical protein